MTGSLKQKPPIQDRDTGLTPQTAVAQCRGVNTNLCQKLAYYEVHTLEDVATKLSRRQLQRMRGVGAKTLAALEQHLTDAGLKLAEEQHYVDERHQQQWVRYHQQQQTLTAQTEQWIQQHRPDCWAAKQRSEPGAYAAYLKAQLAALEWIEGDYVVKREFEHQLVRSLQRYEKQKRYAAGRESLFDTITSHGRKRYKKK